MIIYHKSTTQLILQVFTITLGTFQIGYAMAFMNGVTVEFQRQLSIIDHRIEINGLINSLIPIGAAIGALNSYKLLNFLSLRQSLQFTDLMYFIGYLIQYTFRMEIVLLGRFIIGISVGLNSTIVPQYIKSLSPENLYRFFGGFTQILITFGILTVISFGILMTPDCSNTLVLKFMLFLPIMICSLRFLLIQYIYIQEPPFLFFQSDNSPIQQIFKSESFYFTTQDLVINQNQLYQVINIKQNQFYISSCLLCSLAQFSGINGVIIYSSQLFKEVTNKHSEQCLLNMFLGFINCVCSIIGVYFIKIKNHQFQLKFGFISCTLFQSILCVISLTITDQNVKYLFIIVILSYLIGFQLLLGSKIWIFIAENLNEIGMSNAVLCNWVSCAIVAQFFGIISSSNVGIAGTFGLFAVFSAIGYTIILLKCICGFK